jgi:prepilin-type N-terminal cleavage/methylation domain-containing protein
MRFFRDDSGLSLTELLVVSVLIGVILASAYLLFGAGTNMTNLLTARSNAAYDAQRAVDQISEDLRQTQSTATSTDKHGVIEGTIAATQNTLMIASNVDTTVTAGDTAPAPELVEYSSEATGVYYRLVKRIARHDPAVHVPPFFTAPPTSPSWGPTTDVVPGLLLSVPPVFCFHRSPTSGAASEIAVNTCGADPSHKYPFPDSAYVFNGLNSNAANSNYWVSFVGVRLQVVGRSGNKTVIVPGTAVVRIRTGNEVDK